MLDVLRGTVEPFAGSSVALHLAVADECGHLIIHFADYAAPVCHSADVGAFSRPFVIRFHFLTFRAIHRWRIRCRQCASSCNYMGAFEFVKRFV